MEVVSIMKNAKWMLMPIFIAVVISVMPLAHATAHSVGALSGSELLTSGE
jgi:hypothetical protein